jgi:predicted CoA-binding protein
MSKPNNFPPLQYSGKLIVNIFNSVKTIAVVSASPKPHCAGLPI